MARPRGCDPDDDDDVDTQRFCKRTFGWSDDLQFKLNGSYPLPWDTAVSLTIQNLPGFPIQATYNASNTEIAPSLGRDLSGGVTNVQIDLIEPNTVFDPRRTLADIRFSKRINLGGVSTSANFDIYNAFNSNALQSANTTYGPSWLNGINVVSGCLLRFGVNIDF